MTLTPIEEILNRVLQLVESDPALHDAIVRYLDAMTDEKKAEAEYRRSRIK